MSSSSSPRPAPFGIAGGAHHRPHGPVRRRWALVCLAVCVSLVAAGGAASASPACVSGFPESFYVSTGTTIPASEQAGPITQSGNLFVDGNLGKVRMDQFYMGRQHTLISDRRTHRAYIFHRESPGGKGPTNANCRVFSTVGDAVALCIPASFVQSDQQPVIVRGVPVQRFRSFDREEGPLLQIDHYVLNITVDRAADVVARPFLIPWRMQTRQKASAELKEIAGAPLSLPNWRFFGQPMFDEVDFPLFGCPPSEEKDLTTWRAETEPVTVDFYNFVPGTPDGAVFTVPDECREAAEAWETATTTPSTGTEDGADGEAAGSHQRHPAHPLQLPVAHRFLIDWAVSWAQLRRA